MLVSRGCVPADEGGGAYAPKERILLHEAKILVTMALPLILQKVAQVSSLTVVMTSLGQLGAHELAAASMAMSIFYTSGFAIVCGLSAPSETLLGQVSSSHQAPLSTWNK